MAISKMYGQCLAQALQKKFDFTTDTIKVALYTALTIDQDNDVFLSDLTATEVVAGGGYTTGGATLTTPTITYDGGTNTIKLDAEDVTWSSSTITASYCVIYYDSTVASTSVLIGYTDFEGSESSSNGDFTISWNTNGIATIVAS